MGWVYPTGFAVRKRTVSVNTSSMQPEAKAQFVVAPDGTRMRVRLGPRRWVVISGYIGWFSWCSTSKASCFCVGS